MLELDQFIKLAETERSHAIFIGLDKLVQAHVGAIIFSCSTFDPATRQARRVYTNKPKVYPLSGLKEMTENRWTKTVLDRGETFVGNKLEELAEVFPDYKLIESMGCASVINIPIKLSGDILGTINLLHKAGYYTSARVTEAMKLRPAATIAFCSLSRDSV